MSQTPSTPRHPKRCFFVKCHFLCFFFLPKMMFFPTTLTSNAFLKVVRVFWHACDPATTVRLFLQLHMECGLMLFCSACRLDINAFYFIVLNVLWLNPHCGMHIIVGCFPNYVIVVQQLPPLLASTRVPRISNF